MSWDKPFLNYNQQLEKLFNKHNIICSNNSKVDKTLLESLSYYDLINGYQDCFINNSNITDLSLRTCTNKLDMKFKINNLRNYILFDKV